MRPDDVLRVVTCYGVSDTPLHRQRHEQAVIRTEQHMEMLGHTVQRQDYDPSFSEERPAYLDIYTVKVGKNYPERTGFGGYVYVTDLIPVQDEEPEERLTDLELHRTIMAINGRIHSWRLSTAEISDLGILKQKLERMQQKRIVAAAQRRSGRT